jgi:hypothetical protein
MTGRYRDIKLDGRMAGKSWEADSPVSVFAFRNPDVAEARLDLGYGSLVRRFDLIERTVDSSDSYPFAMWIIGQRTYKVAPNYLHCLISDGEKVASSDPSRRFRQLFQSQPSRARCLEG